MPGGLGTVIKGGVAFVTCHLAQNVIYNVSITGRITKMKGAVSNEAWGAFNPPPAELETAKRTLNRIEVPKGYEWSIVNGAPQLVPVEGKIKGTKKSRTLNPDKYPLGTAVVYMEGTPGKTKPGDTGKIIGYEGNQLVIEYEKKGRIKAQPGSRHRVEA